VCGQLWPVFNHYDGLPLRVSRVRASVAPLSAPHSSGTPAGNWLQVPGLQVSFGFGFEFHILTSWPLKNAQLRAMFVLHTKQTPHFKIGTTIGSTINKQTNIEPRSSDNDSASERAHSRESDHRSATHSLTRAHTH
jgi:hypothetical protein